MIMVANLLSNEAFHDGSSIGKQLNISRTAVWKIIKKLESYGVKINSVKGKGYALHEPLVLLDEKKIQQQLTTPIHIDVFEEISSTIDHIKNNLSSNEIRVCLAETQTHGTGRFQRQWHSPFGKNIYLSMLYTFDKDMSELSGLSILIGLAICSAIDEHCKLNQPVMIKWPNDIICDNKKLAGSLVQIHAETNGYCQTIISVGLNVNMKDDDESNISQPWGSLSSVSNQHYDRNILAAKLINHLVSYLEKFDAHGFEPFLSEWQQKDFLYDRDVKLTSQQQTHQGIGQGVTKQGFLVLKKDDETIQKFSSGDTSLNTLTRSNQC